MGGESLEDMLGGFVTCVDFISLVGPVFSSFCHLDAFVHALMHLSDSFFTYCNCLFLCVLSFVYVDLFCLITFVHIYLQIRFPTQMCQWFFSQHGCPHLTSLAGRKFHMIQNNSC